MPILSSIAAASNKAFGQALATTPKDPYWKYTTLLLNGNGANGAQNNTFVDSSTNNFTITRNGNTTQGSFSPYGSNWSNYFNGSTDYLDGPTNNSAFDFGTGDFTVECWVFATSSSDAYIYSNFGPSGAGGLELTTSSGYLYVWTHQVASLSMTSNTLLPLNQWVHVAVTRSGNNFTIWQNGVSVATQTISLTLKTNAYSPVCVGGIYTGGGAIIPSWKGYISNLRVTKGGALYTSTFTPSTTPLTTTVSSGTVSWLTCQSNRFADSSTNAFAVTAGGSPSVQRFSPFNNTASYSASTVGGSAYFSGSTSDYLLTPATGQFAPAGDFTVSCWFYPITVYSYIGIIGQWGGGNDKWLWEVSSNGTITFFCNGGGSTRVTSSAGAIVAGQWHYLCVTRSGTTITAYINGVSKGTTTLSGTFGSSTHTVNIGAAASGDYTNGYITDVRLVDGTAISATVPTAPLTSTGSQTQLLLNMTNASIPDYAMMNDLQTVGNAQISTSVKKFGTGSISYSSDNSTLKAGATPLFAFGNTFTIEGWFYPTSIAQDHPNSLWNFRDGDINNFELRLDSNGSLTLHHDGNQYAGTSSNVISTNTWYHIAVVDNNGTQTIYVDGVSKATGTSSGATQYTFGNIGSRPAQNWWYTGYIDDFRITSGIARYTSNFTPPTKAHPTLGR